MHVANPDLLTIVANRFAKHIDELRLKDLERFAWVMALFDIDEPHLATAFLESLGKRVEEANKHPTSHLMCIYYLAIKGYHDMDAMTLVLDPSRLRRIYRHVNHYPREILFLDSYARINLIDYQNVDDRPLLTDTVRRLLAKRCSIPLSTDRTDEQHNDADKLIANVAASVRTVYSHFHISHALPHYAKPGL